MENSTEVIYDLVASHCYHEAQRFSELASGYLSSQMLKKCLDYLMEVRHYPEECSTKVYLRGAVTYWRIAIHRHNGLNFENDQEVYFCQETGEKLTCDKEHILSNTEQFTGYLS